MPSFWLCGLKCWWDNFLLTAKSLIVWPHSLKVSKSQNFTQWPCIHKGPVFVSPGHSKATDRESSWATPESLPQPVSQRSQWLWKLLSYQNISTILCCMMFPILPGAPRTIALNSVINSYFLHPLHMEKKWCSYIRLLVTYFCLQVYVPLLKPHQSIAKRTQFQPYNWY